MKPTQRTELFANIRQTFVSFFSILMFVALGVGIFLGISWTAPALQAEADKAFDEGSFHHFQIQYPYGLTDDDLAKLAELDGVSQVEQARQSFQTISVDGMGRTVKVQTVGENIDSLTVTEGELPAKADEIALHAVSAKKLGLNVGDTIEFKPDADSASASTKTDKNGDAKAAASDMKYLTGRTFKVTALVNSADYIAVEPLTYGMSSTPSGAVDSIAWVTADAWNGSAFQDGYPVVNVRSDNLSGLATFGDEYKEKSSSIESRIEELGDELGTARYDDLHGQAQKKIDDGEKKIADGEKAIKDGEKKLAEGKETYEKLKSEGEAKLAAAHDQLMEFESLKSTATKKLNSARNEVNQAKSVISLADEAKAAVNAALSDAHSYKREQLSKLEEQKKKYKAKKITKKQYDAAVNKYHAALDTYGAKVTALLQKEADKIGEKIPKISYEEWDAGLSAAKSVLSSFDKMVVTYKGKTMTIAEARKELDKAARKVAAGERELAKKSAQLDEGWANYNAGKQELEDKTAEYEKQKAEGEKKIADARKQIAENKPKLEDAKAQLAAMKKYDWTVLPRSRNAGEAQVSILTGVTNSLSFSMAGLFVIVGLLVSYSAVSRIVHEQITQIGTKKALGFRAKEITTSFLAYSSLAVIAGAVIGTIVGVLVVERIIGYALGSMFVFGDYPPHFGLPLFLIVTALELVLVLGATWLACRNILREHAIELLKGPKPPEAKTRFYEKWGIWNKLPLFTQTIVNNCMNDKRRVFSTIIGVAGCTALIVTAITLNNDVMKSYDLQYSDVYEFNAVTFVEPETEGALENVEKALQEQGCATARAVYKGYAIESPDGKAATAQVLVPVDEESFFQRYHVTPLSGQVDLSQDGAWVTQAYADHFGAKVGDEIPVNAGDGVKHNVKILGFYEFWLTYHEMVMGRDYFEREFGKIAPNAVLSDTQGASVEDVRQAVSEVPGFYSMTNDKETKFGIFATFSSVSSAVVAIYMVLATLMAIVVLLNLNVMFIDEKKRELIVLMINGFDVGYAKRYIYNDTIVLSAIGIVLGILLGCIMGSLTVGSMEPSTAMFVKSVDWMAVGIGVVGSAVLSVVMSVIALRRIPRFNLTDINKF